jgi:pimeloyl-ACP methyl ester carboxylesterase
MSPRRSSILSAVAGALNLCLFCCTASGVAQEGKPIIQPSATKKEGKVMKMESEVTGKGSTIVLVPGGLTGWLSWQAHAKLLSAKRRVMRVQLLNVQFGLENRPLPADYSVRTESIALGQTLDDLGLDGPVDLVAWSYGAEISLDYALNHSERIRTLTLIEPPALWVLRAKGPLPDDARRNVAMLGTLTGDISEQQLEVFAKSVGLLELSKSGRDLPQWPLWVRHRLSLRNSPAAIDHTDDTARLVAFHRPVLLVKGTGSAPFLHQIIDALASYLPHAEVVQMPAGHAPQIVSMGRFLEKLESFQEQNRKK